MLCYLYLCNKITRNPWIIPGNPEKSQEFVLEKITGFSEIILRLSMPLNGTGQY
jgi:hypothetical protein